MSRGMILDSLANAPAYFALGDRITTALEFLLDPKTSLLEPPAIGTENSLRLPIDGDVVFALIQRYRTKTVAKSFWEAHRKYIDVQCVIQGAELMGHARLSAMRVVQDYDAERDFMKLAPRNEGSEDASAFVRVKANMFTIFMPHDAHMPGLMVNDAPAMVKKIVVKVRT